MLDQWHIAYGIAYQKLEIIHADTPTRRHADTPTRRHADSSDLRPANCSLSLMAWQ